MAILPTKMAAREFRIAVSTLKRRGAAAKVHQGSPGGRDPSLYDTDVLAIVFPRPGKRTTRHLSPEQVEKMRRGELVMTLLPSLEFDLKIFEQTSVLVEHGAISHQREKLASFIRLWIRSKVLSHFGINGSR